MSKEKLSLDGVIKRALDINVPQVTGGLVVDHVIEVEDAQGNTRTVEFMKRLSDEVQE